MDPSVTGLVGAECVWISAQQLTGHLGISAVGSGTVSVSTHTAGQQSPVSGIN